MTEMDYLDRAKSLLELVSDSGDEVAGSEITAASLGAIACGLIALVERIDHMSKPICEGDPGYLIINNIGA